MSTRSDLSAALFGEAGLADRITKYRAGELERWSPPPLEEPHVCKVWFRLGAEVQRVEVAEINVKPGFTGQAIAEEVARKVEQVYGGGPVGELQVCFYPAGQASAPPVKVVRRIIAPDEVEGSPSVEFLRARLATSEQRQAELHGLIANLATAQLQTIHNQGTAIATLATARGGAAAAADVGGPWGLLALGGLVIGYPMLRRTLGLKPDASLEEVIERVTDIGARAYRQLGAEPTPPAPTLPPAPPAGAAPPVAPTEATETPPTDASPATSSTAAAEPTDEDIARALEVYKRVQADPLGLGLRAMNIAQERGIPLPG